MKKKYLDIEIDLSRDSLFDELGIKRLKESYMKDEEESPQERFAFVSSSFASNKEHAQRLYDYSSNHWLSYSTPILSFGRTKYGLPISCFLSWVPDTAKGLVDTLSETNWLSMLGGGVGLGFGIRSAGDKSTGILPHLKTYDASSLAYKQGNTRRGSYAAYLDISHPDIMIFLDIRKPTGDQNIRCLNLHHGVNITNDFMKIIENCMINPGADDRWELKEPHNGLVKEVVSAKELWQKILELRVQTGEPYIHFIDSSNEAMPYFLKERGLKIRQSNLCVSGNQRVPSNLGMLTAKELYESGSELTLASNDGPVDATSMRLVESNAETFIVSLENGMTHTVTGYHKILCKTKNGAEPKALSELSVGDYIAIQTNEGVFGSTEKQQEAFLLGIQHGVGVQVDNNKTIHSNVLESEPSLHKNAKSSLDTKQVEMPTWLWSGTKETQWNYIKGLLYAGGTVIESKSRENKIQINIASNDQSHLKNVQLILANLGVQASLKLISRSDSDFNSERIFKNKECGIQDVYALIIRNKNDAVKIEKFTGLLSKKNISIENNTYRDNKRKFYKISSIESAGKQDVYCVGVHTDQHLWICNGIVTHNCSEILLPTSEDRTAVCCLSSLNIEKYDEWSKDNLFLRDVAEMLDNVLTYFINNAPNEISRAKYSAMRERSIGIGALGFHAYLQKNNIPFESAIAKSTNIKIFKKIRSELEKASTDLASERGEAPDAEGTGKRFSLLMAVAPNACVVGDTKIIMSNGMTKSIEDIGLELGVDINSFEYLTVDLEDGTTRELHIGQELLVERLGKKVKIIASELNNDDDILEIL